MNDAATMAPPITPPPNSAQTEPKQPAQAPPAQAPWLQYITNENVRNSDVLKSLHKIEKPEQALNELATMYHNIQPLVGKRSPNANSPDEEILLYRDSSGVPKESTEYGKIEPIQVGNQTVSLPEELDELIKEIAVSRKLTKGDYQAVGKKLLENIAKTPEMCEQALNEKYGAAAMHINKATTALLDSVPENLKNDLTKSGIVNNPTFRELMSFLASRQTESSLINTGNAQATQQTTDPQHLTSKITNLTSEINKMMREGRGTFDPAMIEKKRELQEAYMQMNNLYNGNAGQKPNVPYSFGNLGGR